MKKWKKDEMIRIANEMDQENIRELWKQNFDDTDIFITAFLAYIFVHGKCYLLEVDGKLVSMTSIIYGTLSGAPTHELVYLYGVATDRSCQKKGYAKALLHYIVEEHEAQSIGVVLVLGHEGLRGFYEKLGFKKFGGLCAFHAYETEENEITLLEQEKAKKCLKRIEIEAYIKLRNAFCEKHPYCICWGTYFMKLCMQDHLFEGGYVASITIENEVVGVWFKIEEEKLVIIEVTADGQLGYEAANKLCIAYGLNGEYYMYEYKNQEQTRVMTSMCSGLVKEWIQDEKGYMNLVLN
ncbi:MAG: GNAT family N-acetyltransferase [Lachnospiraceae bacterium]